MVQKPDRNLDSLRHCLDKLNDRDRRLIEMRYGGAMKIKAVAEKVGRSATGLYKAMARIHKVFLDCVSRRKSAEDTL